MSAVLGAVLGSVISAGANYLMNQQAFANQRSLNREKYTDMMRAARIAGATPSSIISGITGNAGGSVPTASTSNNPVPDLGSSLSNAVSANAAQGQALAAQESAAAASTNAETERQLALMKLRFEPQKYFADIRKSLAEAFNQTKEAFLHGSMKLYYDELTKDIQQIRPWKLAGLRQGLINDMATYNKIVQETKTSKAQEGYFGSAANEANSQARLNNANTEKTYTETLNESLRGFRLQWETSLLNAGIDPNKPFWENTGRMMYTNPKLFNKRMDMFISSLNMIDGRIQDNVGDNYKRNIALGYGLYKLNQIHQKNANSRAYRFGQYGRTISSFIPGAGGSSSLGDSAGVDWWLKD